MLLRMLVCSYASKLYNESVAKKKEGKDQEKNEYEDIGLNCMNGKDDRGGWQNMGTVLALICLSVCLFCSFTTHHHHHQVSKQAKWFMLLEATICRMDPSFKTCNNNMEMKRKTRIEPH